MNPMVEAVRDDFAGQGRVLLMEDELSVAQGLQMILKEEGYGVDVAPTGQSALDTLKRNEFDLLVADLRLPDMNGMEVVREVKRRRPETMVLVITGYAAVDSAVDAFRSGAVDYLPKPFTDDQFKAAVGVALKERGGAHEEALAPAERIKAKNLIHKKQVIEALKRARSGSRREQPVAFVPGTHGVEERGGARVAESAETDRSIKGLILESVGEGILAADQKGVIVFLNRRLEEMLGYSRKEVCGKMRLNQLFRIGEMERVWEDLKAGPEEQAEKSLLFEANLLDRWGERISVQVSPSILQDGAEEKGMVILIRDLKAMRKAENDSLDLSGLLHQDKMMSLGRLAASVIHEINNPLAGILNYLRLMIKIMGRGEPDQEHLEKFKHYLGIVESETDRCAKLISNLLAFSRKSAQEFCPVNVNEALERSILLSKHKSELQNIEIKEELDPHLPQVEGDFNQLQQCVINLIFNAIDAMPEGGTLFLGTRVSSTEGMVEIHVRDTGCGIPEKELAGIFEPFFTTKKEGKGLGLGLSTVKGIIERHKGRIHVESEVDKGTLFVIKLPAVGAP